MSLSISKRKLMSSFNSGITIRCAVCNQDKAFNDDAFFENQVDHLNGWVCDDCKSKHRVAV